MDVKKTKNKTCVRPFYSPPVFQNFQQFGVCAFACAFQELNSKPVFHWPCDDSLKIFLALKWLPLPDVDLQPSI